MKGYTAPQVARLAGLKYMTLDYWARSGFVKPSIQEAKGRGHHRRYSFRDLVALRVARELREAGITLQALRRVVSYLKKRRGLENPLAETFLVTDGRDVFELKGGDKLISVLRHPGQGHLYFVIDLASTVQELRTAVEALHAA